MDLTTLVNNPVIGETYMGRRYYNSKRIVWEPFRFNELGNVASGQYRHTGIWMLDNSKGQTRDLIPYDKKWAAKKMKSLLKEYVALSSQINNLHRLQSL